MLIATRLRSGWMAERFIRYCLVGVVNTATDLSIFVFLTSGLKIAAVSANVVSYTTALGVSFLLNRHFTFRDAGYDLAPMAQLYRFVAVNLGCLVMSTGAIWLLAAVLTPVAAKLVTIPFVTAWGFAAARIFVFQPKA